MNKFFDYIQPTIVKTSNHPALPEELRNKYLLNYNVFGIKYFEQYYLLSESNEGIPYLLMKEDNWAIELESSNDDFDDILDIPRLYIDITDKFIDGSELFRSFIFQAVMENSIYAKGIEGFEAGKDYWLNVTLYNYLANTNQIEIPNFDARMPNYITEHIEISEFFDDLSYTPYKDYTNLEYYNKKNHLRDNKYSEEVLLDFYVNFCKIILNDTTITQEKLYSGNNQIYNRVLNYFVNYKSDEAAITLNLILNNKFASSSSTSAKSNSCNSCNSSTNTNIVDQTCSSLYSEAMLEYLKQMLGDIEFYCDWFMIDLGDDNKMINDVLIENLKTLFKEFYELEISLDFSSSSIVHSSFCCKDTINSSYSKSNYKILDNYLKVLQFVEENTLLQNTNKIKIYGEAFGELLPKLQF